MEQLKSEEKPKKVASGEKKKKKKKNEGEEGAKASTNGKKEKRKVTFEDAREEKAVVAPETNGEANVKKSDSKLKLIEGEDEAVDKQTLNDSSVFQEKVQTPQQEKLQPIFKPDQKVEKESLASIVDPEKFDLKGISYSFVLFILEWKLHGEEWQQRPGKDKCEIIWKKILKYPGSASWGTSEIAQLWGTAMSNLHSTFQPRDNLPLKVLTYVIFTI